tara:strand:- start:655 stop:1725 length:1071 start_codon:yes stop_codon:yes gene_type:complete
MRPGLPLAFIWVTISIIGYWRYPIIEEVDVSKTGQSSPSASIKPPEFQLEIVPLSVDFGDQFIGEICRSKVVLQNNSSQNLVIRNISSTCGCLTTFSGDVELAAGENCKLPIEINTVHKAVGEFKGRFTISVTSGEQQTTKIIPVSVNLNSRGLLVCEPKFISLGQVQSGSNVKFSLKCIAKVSETNQSQLEWRVSCPTWANSVEKEDENSIQVDFVGLVPNRTGPLLDNIQIVHHDRTIKVSISGDVIGALSFKPNRIVHVMGAGDTMCEHDIKLSCSKGKKFELNSISYENIPSASVKVVVYKSEKEGLRGKLRFNLDLISKSQIIKGTIVAHCVVEGDELDVTLPVIIIRRSF